MSYGSEAKSDSLSTQGRCRGEGRKRDRVYVGRRNLETTRRNSVPSAMVSEGKRDGGDAVFVCIRKDSDG